MKAKHFLDLRKILILCAVLFWIVTASASANDTLNKDQAEQAIEAACQKRAQSLKQIRNRQWQKKELRIGDDVMKFQTRLFGPCPAGGRSLYISMHGGGGTSAEVNDQQWQNQVKLYQTPEGSIYLAPRAPTDTWNMWHREHIDDFFDRIIEDCILFEHVNPDKVYLMGYSAGGDGVYQLAPRMADRFAAASMMAGHPNEASPEGLRNLPFAIWVGQNDAAYQRNDIARSWGQLLAQLHKKDPNGYVHTVHIVENTGHWMNRKDAAAVEWMAQYQRNPLPERVVWKQDDVLHDRFYWLSVKPQAAKINSLLVAEISGQTIRIEKAIGIESMTIRLSDHMLDLDRPVCVEYEDRQLFQGLAERRLSAIEQSLEERFDPSQVFTAEIAVSLTSDKSDQSLQALKVKR